MMTNVEAAEVVATGGGIAPHRKNRHHWSRTPHREHCKGRSRGQITVKYYAEHASHKLGRRGVRNDDAE